jgi:hypothetical protein
MRVKIQNILNGYVDYSGMSNQNDTSFLYKKQKVSKVLLGKRIMNSSRNYIKSLGYERD